MLHLNQDQRRNEMSTQDQFSDEDLQLLEQWGWQKNDDMFVGEYRTTHSNVSGQIEFRNNAWNFYILDCPQQVLTGIHGNCLRSRPLHKGQHRYWVHFHSGKTPDPITGILAIQNMIEEDLKESSENTPNSPG